MWYNFIRNGIGFEDYRIMNKTLKLALFSAIIATAGFAIFQYNSKESESSVENSTQKEVATTKVESEISQPKVVTEDVVEKIEKSEPAKETVANVSKDEKTEIVEKIDPISSDTLNSKSFKKDGKTVVLFRDGTNVTDVEINKELDNIPEQLSAKMSLSEIKSFLAWKEAYKKIMTEAAIRSGITKSDKVRALIEKRKETAAGFMLLDEKAKSLMSFDALKKHYDKIWDKNFKGTKEFSLIAITTSDKTTADNIKNTVKDEKSLKNILNANAANTKHMDMDSRPQGMFPPEISEAVLKQGANTIVGPFEIKGSFMFFYVKSVKDAQKKEFTETFAEEYKKVATKEFITDYTKNLYKKYTVNIFDVNNNVIDPFNIINKTKKDQNQENLLKMTKLKDDSILAKFKGGDIKVKDLKDFFKVESILDETFVSMAKQFNISPEEVVVYAVKLVMDDKVLAKEVKELKYDQSQKVVDKLIEIGNMEAQHAYFKENVKVKSEDIKKTFDKFIKSIPEEDKNDNEISVKLAFFSTQEDATQALKMITSGEEKFGGIFKDKFGKKEALDLGYVKKKGTSPELWGLLKTGASGACCQRIVELNSDQFGIKEKNYVLVYIADRRPVTLPSLSNEAEKKYFQRLAEREKAVELAKSHLVAGVKSINGKTIEDMNKINPEYVNRMISVLLGYAG